MEGHDIQELAVTAKDSVIVRGGYPAPYSSPNGGEYFHEYFAAYIMSVMSFHSTSDLHELMRKMVLSQYLTFTKLEMLMNIMFYLSVVSLYTCHLHVKNSTSKLRIYTRVVSFFVIIAFCLRVLSIRTPRVLIPRRKARSHLRFALDTRPKYKKLFRSASK